jgi:transposase
MGGVVIGVDPHKRSNTIEVMDQDASVLAAGRFGTDTVGYRSMLAQGRRYPDRRWAVEGANGVGKHLAQRLVADGETVLDVPAKLAARVRVFSTGNGRKTDPADAHSIALAALHAEGVLQVAPDDAMVALKLLADRRDELVAARTQAVNRLHRLLTELVAGGAKRDLTATKARALLATVRPRDTVGRTRRALAVEQLAEVAAADRKLTAIGKRITAAVADTGTGLTGLFGIGPGGAARILGDVGHVHRFPTKAHFASWTGTAPIDALQR